MENSKRFAFIFVLTITAALYWYGSMMWEYDHHLRYMYSDQEGYYMYLPAVFIHGGFENIPVRDTFEYKPYPGTHKILTRFTYGVALLEAPFFLAAHGSRYIQKLPLTDPFANDYSVAILLSASFYTALGLYFLFLVLKRVIKNDFVVWLTVAIILFGTNLPYLATRQSGMSHHYTFCLVSLLIYYLPRFFEKSTPSVRTTILVSILISLIVLIRPTNILIAFIAVLFDSRTYEALKLRCQWFINNFKKICIGVLAAISIWIPQFIYWHYVSGNWFLYSYTEAQFIYFNDPYLWQIFLHPCNGFLIYSPVMVLSLIGLSITAWRNELNGRWIALSFVILSYLCASWSCWWFGGTYGYRSFIDFYPLLAFGLAFLLEQIFTKNAFALKSLTLIFIALCLLINVRMITYYYFFQVEFRGENTQQLIDAVKCCLWIIRC
jgi:hypothetical protein